jgi:hypothetical protein
VLLAFQQAGLSVLWWAIPACLVVLGILALLSLWFFRGYERLSRSVLEAAYADVDTHRVPIPGDVVLVYRTYHGFLAWSTEKTHHVFLRPDDGRRLLGRLLHFNLTWGLLGHAGLLVPLLAIPSYIAQRRSITKQARAAASSPHLSAFAQGAVLREPIGEFRLRRLFGGLAAVVCALFAVEAIVALANRQAAGAAGGALLAVLLGWVARDWLRGRPRVFK